MKRHSFMVYVYELNLDGVITRVESANKCNYKKTIANYKANGVNKVWITLVDKYYWQE